MRWNLLLAALMLVTACTPASPDPSPTVEAEIGESAGGPSAAASAAPWPAAPDAPAVELDPEVGNALDRLVSAFVDGELDREALAVVVASQDTRLAWLLSDLLRFTQGHADATALVDAFAGLTGVDPRGDERFGAVPWLSVTNLLIAWDLPAPADYRVHKARLFLAVEPAWEPFFADEDSAIDWRFLSWGGVLIDDRPSGDTQPCPRGCIPALDDPALTAGEEGDWYADDRIVFAVTVGDESVAFPKHIMEVHEMVNLTIGGRRVGMPYCTLCGSAQAYLTDAVPEGIRTPVLRTSGLLSRSNKVMYDLVTDSVFNTFTGRALSGPLHDAGFVLEQASVVVTTWGEWKQTRPDTRIVAEDGGIGRSYPDDPLGGRDDGGPIFPIGQADPRLPAQAEVLGVIDPRAGPIAFPVDAAEAELLGGGEVALESIEVFTDAGGLRARRRGGDELPAHQAFWFAWSQFHPSTSIWAGRPGSDPEPSPSDKAENRNAICAGLENLADLEASLAQVRSAGSDPADAIATARDALADARASLASQSDSGSGAALHQALLESLDAIGDHLRAAALIDEGAALQEAVDRTPFITTDRVELEVQRAIESGFAC